MPCVHKTPYGRHGAWAPPSDLGPLPGPLCRLPGFWEPRAACLIDGQNASQGLLFYIKALAFEQDLGGLSDRRGVSDPIRCLVPWRSSPGLPLPSRGALQLPPQNWAEPWAGEPSRVGMDFKLQIKGNTWKQLQKDGLEGKQTVLSQARSHTRLARGRDWGHS